MKYLVEGVPVLICLLAILGCSSTPREGSVEGELRGMVYDIDRQPVQDAVLRVAGASNPAGLTDLHGRFGIAPVRFGPVTLSVSKQGYEPVDMTFQFQDSAQVVYLQVASIDQLFDRAAGALENKDWKNYRSFLERAQRLAPTSLQGLILEASGLELQGNLDGAIALIVGYTADQPVLALDLFLGDLYARKGDKERALARWTSALLLREDSALRAKIEKLGN